MADKDKRNKQCTRCMETLPMEDFYYVPAKGSYTAKCKTCTIEYNSERRALGPRPRSKKVSLVDAHRKLLSGLGPGIAVLQGRYIHGYKNFVLYVAPWGCVLDGELLYGTHSIDDILYMLSHRHMKLMKSVESGTDLDTVLEKITLVRNSCGVPILVRFVKSLVLLDQYFLWMDKPRKLLISEASLQLSLSQDLIQFLLGTEKTRCNPIISAPVILKNPSDNSPQVYDFIEE